MLWVSQNAINQGSMNEHIQKNRELYKDLKFGDPQYIEWADDDLELAELTYIFAITPWDYSNGMLIKKDNSVLIELLKEYGYNIKKTLPILLRMVNKYINKVNK